MIIDPTDTQAQARGATPQETPVIFLNCHKYHELARYEDDYDNAALPPDVSGRLLEIRALIFNSAAAEEVGQITETLKWGEPAYLTSQSKSGSTIRIGWKPSDPERYAVYFNCQTTLVDTFRTLFPEMNFNGNRAIVLDESNDLPVEGRQAMS
jgi:hypothetical protein